MSGWLRGGGCEGSGAGVQVAVVLAVGRGGQLGDVQVGAGRKLGMGRHGAFGFGKWLVSYRVVSCRVVRGIRGRGYIRQLKRGGGSVSSVCLSGTSYSL